MASSRHETREMVPHGAIDRETPSREFVFDVPPAFVDLMTSLSEQRAGDSLAADDLFFQLTGRYLCHADSRYQQTPPELFPFAQMGVDGVHYGYVIHAPELQADDYPVGEFCPMEDEGVSLVGNSTREAIENLASERLGHLWHGSDEEKRDGSEVVLRAARTLGLAPDPQKAHRRYDRRGNGKPVVPQKPKGWAYQVSADGVGVLAPCEKFRPGPYVLLDFQTPATRFLEEAKKAYADGHPATALLHLRNGYWYHWTEHGVAREFSTRLVDVYQALGRSSLAEAVERRLRMVEGTREYT